MQRSLDELERPSIPAIRGRAVEERAAASQAVRCRKGKAENTPALYPTAVICGALIEAKTTITKTYTATTMAATTLAPSTNTIRVSPIAICLARRYRIERRTSDLLVEAAPGAA